MCSEKKFDDPKLEEQYWETFEIQPLTREEFMRRVNEASRRLTERLLNEDLTPEQRELAKQARTRRSNDEEATNEEEAT